MADNPSVNVIVGVMFSNCWHMHISMGKFDRDDVDQVQHYSYVLDRVAGGAAWHL